MRRTLVIAVAALAVVAIPPGAQPFETHPPTTSLNEPTAHTLHGGEFRIGSIRLFVNLPNPGTIFSLSQLPWLDVEYGLTSRLQIGTTILENVWEGPNVWVKFNALRTRQLALAMPLTIDVDLDPFVAGVASGLSISWSPMGAASLHTGTRFWAYDGQVQLSRVWTALEWNLFDHTHLLAEVDLWPLVVEIGSLTRFGAVNFEISSRIVDDAKPNIDLQLEFFLRF